MDQTTLNPAVSGNTPPRRRILREGVNSWRVVRATRASVLIDAADYFARLEQALRRARKSIMIVGWDFDAAIRLRPDDPHCPALGDFLRALVEERPGLEVRVLVWSIAVIHAPGSPLPLLLGADWEKHPRIQLRLDREHPLYGAHHQKIVCVDDTVAFVGGIDLTVRRWDTSVHEAEHELRKGPDGVPYPPVHDVQMAVEGEAARAVSEVACERWRRAVREEIPPVAGGADVWPDDLAADFTDKPVAVSRTFPSWRGRPEIAEGMRLALDALRAARRTIYIEAQYLTVPRIGELLAETLARSEGPEIVIILRRRFSGWMERVVMGGNQKRLVQRLRRADRHGRFGAFYPVATDGKCPITVHSKVIVIDDEFLRAGSSNLANRSVALDTELDLAIEAGDDHTRRTIAGIRNRLIADHLGRTPQDVDAAMHSEGSLLRIIDRLGGSGRGLRKISDLGNLPERPVFGTRLVDRERPFFLFGRKGADAA